MHRFIIFTLVIWAFAVDAQGPYQYSPYGAQTATGAIGGQYAQQTGAASTHDKKNFGMNFSSDKGSTSTLNNVNAQAAGTTAYAQGQGLYPQQYQYPVVNPYVNPYQGYPYQQQPVPSYVVPQTTRPSNGWGWGY